MEIISYFSVNNAEMKICKSTAFQEKYKRGKFFIDYVEGKSDDVRYREIEEKDIPYYVKYANIISQCIDNYRLLSPTEQETVKHKIFNLGHFGYSETGNNKIEIWNENFNHLDSCLRYGIKNFLKDNFEFDYYKNLIIEWEDKSDEECITIEGDYPDRRYWDSPFKSKCIKYMGYSLHSAILLFIGGRLNSSSNPFRNIKGLYNLHISIL